MPRLRSDRGPSAADLAARVKACRLALGLTQQEMAARLGIKRGTYREHEKSANPQYTTILGLIVEGGMDPRILCPELVELIAPASPGPAPRHRG